MDLTISSTCIESEAPAETTIESNQQSTSSSDNDHVPLDTVHLDATATEPKHHNKQVPSTSKDGNECEMTEDRNDGVFLTDDILQPMGPNMQNTSSTNLITTKTHLDNVDNSDIPLDKLTSTEATTHLNDTEEYNVDTAIDTSNMISKEEADALIKAGIADALAKERMEVAARRQVEEADFISRSEAEALARARLDEALKKERDRTSTLLTQAQADTMARNYAEQALVEERNKRNSQDSMRKAYPPPLPPSSSSSSFLARVKTSPSQNNLTISRPLPRRSSNTSIVPSPKPSTSTSSTNTTASTNSSRRGILSGFLKLQPSISTPANSNNRLRPTASANSLRRTTASSSSTQQQPNSQLSALASQRRGGSTDSERHLPVPSPSFGTVRITETSTYSKTPSMQQRMRQPSMQSISTMNSSDSYQRGMTPSFFSMGDKQTNVELISAITQTMIGEWMWKHTRKHVGGGISDNKHKRFFWVHPYTRTLYWSMHEPGMDADESKAKSAFIESVSSIPSNDTMGASPLSLLIKTAKRDLKLTAPSLERHELWRMSLSYLLVPPGEESMMEDVIQVDPYHDADTNTSFSSMPSTMESNNDGQDHPNDVPEEVKGEHGVGDDDDSDESMDAMVNVRQCCENHDVSTLSRH
ncbi:meiotic cell cortex C-terminal pleckstrin homology-domain-containing protein [Halteromyces radiatus]|uniref:meiotic cell cortex C-terminal pleckstrin homology-domain-containing protein n=1 Tax=Halteromyces radiatus TaxID=101107 RepID=UPI00221E8F46|nr:meiotic cell cortex C-terminal pleckstrin homology-domain-containing protein [Halteromyces radiatus]KAI8086465.1 meiotic cell cortex C-terminal pleckstrin homology-domain-containing protein [Halteromyces radiatus]